MFELIEEPLDEVALSIDRGIDGALNLPVALGGDMPAPAMRGDQIEDGAGVVAAVGHHVAGRG